jgi:hypothetical protein
VRVIVLFEDLRYTSRHNKKGRGRGKEENNDANTLTTTNSAENKKVSLHAKTQSKQAGNSRLQGPFSSLLQPPSSEVNYRGGCSSSAHTSVVVSLRYAISLHAFAFFFPSVSVAVFRAGDVGFA